MNKDIIRFYENGRKKLIMVNVSEEKAQEWCVSPKTSKVGKWFDGFVSTNRNIYNCQMGTALYPSNYSPDDLT